MTQFKIVVSDSPLPSPFRGDRLAERIVRLGAVQAPWNADAEAHRATIAEGVRLAAEAGADIVMLQELTLSPYFCFDPEVDLALSRFGEDLETGPTVTFARELAQRHGCAVHASLYERPSADEAAGLADGLGFNTAICVDRSGALVAVTRKTHIPEFVYYHEDRYFATSGGRGDVFAIDGINYAFPTCWDQWFPELARSYSLDGAEVIVYPTAIGSEPHRPGFDSAPMWRHMITANGLANATYMVAINRIGTEGPLQFYGSSFISDPYGRVVVEADRTSPTVLVAEVDLGQREDWLDFGLLYTRRPDAYERLRSGSDLGR